MYLCKITDFKREWQTEAACHLGFVGQFPGRWFEI